MAKKKNNNNNNTALIVGIGAIGAVGAFMLLNGGSEEFFTAGAGGVGMSTSAPEETSITPSSFNTDREVKEENFISLMQQAEGASRAILTDSGSSQIIVQDTGNNRQRFASDKAINTIKDFTGTDSNFVTLATEDGKATGVLDLGKRQSRSADGAFSVAPEFGGGVGFNDAPSNFERFRNSFNWRGRF